jgi:hypothetical protein
MNDWGDVVGEGTGGTLPNRAWVSLVDGGQRLPMLDLNDLLDGSEEYDADGNFTPGHWTHLSSASGINNWGQIVGAGRVQTDTRDHIYRYTPAEIAPNQIPVFEEIPISTNIVTEPAAARIGSAGRSSGVSGGSAM